MISNVQVFVGALSPHYEALSVEASKQTSSEEIVNCITEKLSLTDGSGGPYELAEVMILLDFRMTLTKTLYTVLITKYTHH